MAAGKLTQLYRYINTLLLALMIVLGLSGIIMLYGSWRPWVFDLHRVAGFALILLAPWKGAIIYRSLVRGLRKTFDRSLVVIISLLFLLLVALVTGLGILWMWRFGPYTGPFYQTLVAWHWILGLLLTPLLFFHVWRRWPKPKKVDLLSRRSFLQLAGLAGAGLALGGVATRLAEARATQASPRRFTGSRGMGIFSGNDFPIVGEAIQVVDPSLWRLEVSGAVKTSLSLAYEDILAQTPRTLTEILDCTNGWFSIQDWQGVLLSDLLEQAGAQENIAGVRLVSTTGYNHSYPLAEARQILLATHVTGEVLAPQHGFPVRAVVPGRRGWFWVKWLTKVEVLEYPWEVIGGILWSPREVLRQW